MTNQVITLTLATENESDAKKVKASHDAYFQHESVIDGSTVTCEHHDLTGRSTRSQGHATK